MDCSLDLAPWPNVQGLLSGYLARLETLPPSVVREAWLYKAACSAQSRPEQAAHFEALEWAASQCDDTARRALRKKFEGALARKPKTVRRQDNNSLLDVIVELAAYGWLRREYPPGELEYVCRGRGKTPDLQMRLGEKVIGIECKNIHMSEDVSAALSAGEMVSGLGGVTGEFRGKVRDTLSRGRTQLEGYEHKMIFLNYTPDPDLWTAECVQEEEVQALFRDEAPVDTDLIVFRNYGWKKASYRFRPESP